MLVKRIPGLTLAAALLASALLPATALAQDPPPEQEPPAEREQGAAQESQQVPARGSSEDSPYDYKSSEEISEDLSVSFPVDI